MFFAVLACLVNVGDLMHFIYLFACLVVYIFILVAFLFMYLFSSMFSFDCLLFNLWSIYLVFMCIFSVATWYLYLLYPKCQAVKRHASKNFPVL